MASASDAVVGAQAAGYQRPMVECKEASHATVEQLLANDPDVAGLIVSEEDDFLDLDENDEIDQQYKLAVIGRAISKNTHLRKLAIEGHRRGLKLFFNLLARNRSIEDFSVWKVNFADADVDISSILDPFFEHNMNLRAISINSANISCNIPSIITALSRSGASRLERLSLLGMSVGDKRAADLISALNCMPGLHNLVDLDLGCNKIKRRGWMALSSLLMNSECRVHSLCMSQNQLDMESIGKFINGLAGNKSLKTLHISGCTLDTKGWLLFMAFLSSPSCSFENIVMGDDNINDECAAALGTSLAVNETLKSLQLNGKKITPTGWRQFFNFLKSTTTSLVGLDLSCPSINDEAAIFMFSALANNTSLERLEIALSDAVTSLGWIECFRQLMGSKSALESICIIDGTNIDDEGAAFLVHLISKCICTVLFLEFIGNTSITAEGWRQFAECLHPKSASSLILLRIGLSDQSEYDNNITDDVVIDLFVALTNNRSLHELDFDQTELSWGSLDVLTNILCNKTSIASIWQSNHTLESLGCLDPGEFSTELETLLEQNKGRYKADVARTKIMMYSVLDEETVCHVFAPMATTVLPTAIEWIGRDRLGFSVMYCLVHNMPSLFEHGTISGSNDSVALESPRKRPYWNISY